MIAHGSLRQMALSAGVEDALDIVANHGVNAFVLKPVDFHRVVNAMKETGRFPGSDQRPVVESVRKQITSGRAHAKPVADFIDRR